MTLPTITFKHVANTAICYYNGITVAVVDGCAGLGSLNTEAVAAWALGTFEGMDDSQVQVECSAGVTRLNNNDLPND